MLVVDTSGSMEGSKLDQAKQALTTSVNALGSGQPAGLRSYAGECGNQGILRVPIGGNNRDALRDSIAGLTAGGGTPTPDALRGAAGDLARVSGRKTIVLISDGQSTCGDPCPTAEAIKKDQGIDFKIHTVGFQAPSEAESELACVAKATGGKYVSVSDKEGLSKAIDDAVGGGSNNACDSGIPDISTLDGIAALLGPQNSSVIPLFDKIKQIPIPCLNASGAPIVKRDDLLVLLVQNRYDSLRTCVASIGTTVAFSGVFAVLLVPIVVALAAFVADAAAGFAVAGLVGGAGLVLVKLPPADEIFRKIDDAATIVDYFNGTLAQLIRDSCNGFSTADKQLRDYINKQAQSNSSNLATY